MPCSTRSALVTAQWLNPSASHLPAVATHSALSAPRSSARSFLACHGSLLPALCCSLRSAAPCALCSLRSLLPALFAPCALCSLRSLLPALASSSPCTAHTDQTGENVARADIEIDALSPVDGLERLMQAVARARRLVQGRAFEDARVTLRTPLFTDFLGFNPGSASARGRRADPHFPASNLLRARAHASSHRLFPPPLPTADGFALEPRNLEPPYRPHICIGCQSVDSNPTPSPRQLYSS